MNYEWTETVTVTRHESERSDGEKWSSSEVYTKWELSTEIVVRREPAEERFKATVENKSDWRLDHWGVKVIAVSTQFAELDYHASAPSLEAGKRMVEDYLTCWHEATPGE